MASILEHDQNDIPEEQSRQVMSFLEDEEQDDIHHISEEYDDDNAENDEIYQSDNYQDDTRNQRIMFKMLVPDVVAGAIIGKSGATIKELQAQSNAKIRVSQSNDFFPGSKDRAIVLIGQLQSVLDAQKLLWDKISQFSKPYHANRPSPPPLDGSLSQVMGKVLIPNDAGGLIIGHGGATIKAIHHESGATVNMNSKDEPESKISKERVLIIAGSKEACVECTRLIILKLQEDPNLNYQNKTSSYSNSLGLRGILSHQTDLNLPKGAETVSEKTIITIKVPDNLIGFILGKRGVVITEIQHLSGAKIDISPRAPRDADSSEPSEESNIRLVTITGSPNAAQMAQFLVTQKLQIDKDGTSRSHHRR